MWQLNVGRINVLNKSLVKMELFALLRINVLVPLKMCQLVVTSHSCAGMENHRLLTHVNAQSVCVTAHTVNA